MTGGILKRLSAPSQPLLLAAGFAIIVLMSLTSVWLAQQSEEQSKLVEHTLDVKNQLANLLLDLRRTESGQRGYLLTGNANYLEDYSDAVAEIEPAIDKLHGSLPDGAPEKAALSATEPLIRAKLTELAQTLKLYDSGQTQAALALVRGDAGRQYMVDIRQRIDAISAQEEALLTRRSREASRTDRRLVIITISGAALILLLAALSVFLVRRSNRERDVANRELADANANLEATVAERTADLREANEEIQRFAYIVSHDLRSPLVNIMGFTTELAAVRKEVFERLDAQRPHEAEAAAARAGSPDEAALARDFDEALSFIKTSTTKMDRLINAILQLSREGRRAFQPEAVDMSGLLETIAASMTHQAHDVGAEFSIAPLPDVTSDRLALEQIFSNLLDNALKYSRPGVPGRIEVTGRTTSSHIVYEVKDNGRGVDPKDHQRIFDLFRRAGPQDRPGEGIGLAHVRALVRRLGGSMSIKSELGQGSVFTVTLPRRWIMQQERSAA
jgi:signal transduction histidine kinase